MRSQRQALKLLGISTGSWHYRRFGDPRRAAAPIPQKARRQPQQLTDQEVDTIKQLLHDGWGKGLSTHTICRLATDRGEHVASPRTFDRIAKTLRRRPPGPTPRRKPQVKVPPVVVADHPDAAWSWDITDLPGEFVGQRYKAYVVTDIYSRRIVAFRIEQRECQRKAAAMFTQAFARTTPKVVHADSGAAMIAGAVTDVFDAHGVVESHSRPRVSNDNPYSEAVFATMKTHASYPGIFTSLDHARAWCASWIESYNTTHLHSGIGFHSPDEVYTGAWQTRRQARQHALDAHYAAHPERYRQPPQAPSPNPIVGINLHHQRLTTG